MSQCANCGAELDPEAKFCMECGNAIPQVKKCVQCGIELPLKAKFCFGCGAPQGDLTTPITGVNMGDKNVIAGDVVGQKIAGDNVQSKIMGNAFFNTYQDDTKKVVSCHVCGKHLTNDNGYTCPECGNVVCDDHFDKKHNRCKICVHNGIKKIIVAEKGGGDFLSISEAVSFAKAGTTIVVKPGEYKERIFIDKELCLYGESDENNNPPIIWNDTFVVDCVIDVNAKAEICNFRVVGRKSEVPNDLKEKILSSTIPSMLNEVSSDVFWPKTIYVHAPCTLKGVDVACSIGYGIAVAKNVDNVKLKNCNIHDNLKCGLYSADNSSISIEMCSLYLNKIGSIFNTSNVSLWNTSVFQNFSGINSHFSKFKMESCILYENEQGGRFLNSNLLIKDSSFGSSKLQYDKHKKENNDFAIKRNVRGILFEESEVVVEKSFIFDNCVFNNLNNILFKYCNFKVGYSTDEILFPLRIFNPTYVSIENSSFKLITEEPLKCWGVYIKQDKDIPSVKIQISNTTFENLSNAVVFNTSKYEGNCVIQNCFFNRIVDHVMMSLSTSIWKVSVLSCKIMKSIWADYSFLSNIKFENKKEIHVSHDNQGDFSTIAEAINCAKNDSIIFVEYGVYYEHFVIDKPITIIGEKNEKGFSPIIRESIKNINNCIDIKACATLKNLIIESVDSADNITSLELDEEKNYAAICIRADAVLENVGVNGWLNSGIVVIGKNIKPQLLNCDLTKNATGIMFVMGAMGKIEDCVISNNLQGVKLKDLNTNPYFVRCRIEYNKSVGLTCLCGANSLISSCVLNRNGSVGVEIRDDGANLHIIESEIKLNENGGIRALNGALCVIDKCDIWSNSLYGVKGENSHTKINVANSDISFNEDCGMYLSDEAYGTIVDSKITYNKAGGVCAQGDNSVLDIKKCSIQSNDNVGVAYINCAYGNVECSHVCNNSGENFSIGEGCSPCIDMDSLFGN